MKPQLSVAKADSESIEEWAKGGFGRRPMRLSTKGWTLTPETIGRKVRALLNKLTMSTFDSISAQIIHWANMSRTETDARTLKQIIQLVYEAMDENEWLVEIFARLCRKIMEQISPKVQDVGTKNAEGRPITGGHLFRNYLLGRCQEDFERGWVAREIIADTALFEEYYTFQKAKRQCIVLIKFIGELFKLQMLTERIMHECVKKLLGNVDNPEEEEIESLCKLLSTVGQLLDTPKARAHMDVYFSRMKDLIRSPDVSSRLKFRLQDVVDLRERRWVSLGEGAALATQDGLEIRSRLCPLHKKRSQINDIITEFLVLRNLDAAEAYFPNLSPQYHEDLVHALVLKALESKEADVTLIASLFARVASKNLCTHTSFQQAFSRVAESLEDIVIDSPKARDFMDIMVKGASLTGDSQRWMMPKTMHTKEIPFFDARSAVDGPIRSPTSDTTNTDIDPAEQVWQIYSLPFIFGHLLGDDGGTDALTSSGTHDRIKNNEVVSIRAKDAPGITVRGINGASHSESAPESSTFTGPQRNVDDIMNTQQYHSPNAGPSDLRQLYVGQIEEYRSREASWSKEVEFLRQQVAAWQELYEQSQEARERTVSQYYRAARSDTCPSSEFAFSETESSITLDDDILE
ncbi:hypothetical protein EYR40_007066 [Pleurotus pulmonarius]|nr:hypothetical protein EYR36_003663 [Pleurotus pulmonarius]KAF4599960.1 hypothetical protein EYR40_007066 [Pleurotus pulmonarius]